MPPSSLNLPVELLGRIFLAGCDSSDQENIGGTRSPSSPRRLKQFLRSAVLVCSHWHDVIAASPQLYFARASLPRPARNVNQNLNTFRKALQSSDGCDLYISIDIHSDRLDPVSKLILHAVNMLVPFVHQFRTFRAVARRRVIMSVILELINGINYAPRFQSLILKETTLRDFSAADAKIDLGIYPISSGTCCLDFSNANNSITRLQLDGVFLQWLVVSCAVTSVAITRANNARLNHSPINWNTIEHILDQCHHLNDIRLSLPWELPDKYSITTPSAEQCIFLPHLAQIDIDAPPHSMIWFLSQLQTSPVQTLLLKFTPEATFVEFDLPVIHLPAVEKMTARSMSPKYFCKFLALLNTPNVQDLCLSLNTDLEDPFPATTKLYTSATRITLSGHWSAIYRMLEHLDQNTFPHLQLGSSLWHDDPPIMPWPGPDHDRPRILLPNVCTLNVADKLSFIHLLTLPSLRTLFIDSDAAQVLATGLKGTALPTLQIFAHLKNLHIAMPLYGKTLTRHPMSYFINLERIDIHISFYSQLPEALEALQWFIIPPRDTMLHNGLPEGSLPHLRKLYLVMPTWTVVDDKNRLQWNVWLTRIVESRAQWDLRLEEAAVRHDFSSWDYAVRSGD